MVLLVPWAHQNESLMSPMMMMIAVMMMRVCSPLAPLYPLPISITVTMAVVIATTAITTNAALVADDHHREEAT